MVVIVFKDSYLCLFFWQVPEGLVVVMSATTWEHSKGKNTFLFRMEQPIPSYLVALAVGDMVSAKVGPR